MWTAKNVSRHFPGGPVVRSPCFYFRGHEFDPWAGKLPTCHAEWTIHNASRYWQMSWGSGEWHLPQGRNTDLRRISINNSKYTFLREISNFYFNLRFPITHPSHRCLMCLFSRTVITNPQTGRQKFIFSSSGGWKSKIKALKGLALLRPLFPWLSDAHFLTVFSCPFFCTWESLVSLSLSRTPVLLD